MKSSALLSCSILLATSLPAWCQLADSGWPDYGGGYANQHRSPYKGPSASPRIAWTYDLQTIPTGQSFNRGYHQPILLPEGTIVLNTADSDRDAIVALNPDGTRRWYALDNSLGPWLAADQNNQIYTIRDVDYLTPSTRLRAVSFSGGNLWSVGLSGNNPAQNGPAVGRDGKIYGANDFSPLTAVTPGGASAWTSLNSGYYVNPAVDAQGTIYVGGHALAALNADGSVKWSYPLRTQYGYYPSYLSPAIADDGTIYAGQINLPNLVALTPDGSEIWARTDLGGAPAVGTNGDIYVVPESGILTALNPLDGSTRWTYPAGKTDYYTSEGVTVDRLGNLYLSNQDGILMSLTSEGHLRWSLDLAPNQSGFIGSSAPVIGNDGALYVVGGNTGKVFAVVPEPSTLVLVGFGAFSALAYACRRRKNAARSFSPINPSGVN
jgi:outer membrane protein assembly factor BamB